MTTSADTNALSFSLPVDNCYGADLMIEHVLQSSEAKKIVIEALIGQGANEHYSPNLLESSVVYAADKSKDRPPVLVEFSSAVDKNYLLRVLRHCDEIFSAYGALPVVLVTAIDQCSRQVLNKATKNKSKPFLFKLPCYPWANQCFILSKESISSHIDKIPLDPVVALGSFFMEQKQLLAEHTHHDDPTIQQLYYIAEPIIQKQVTEHSRISHLLRVINEIELRCGKAIRMLDDDADYSNAKKRTIDLLKEGMAFIRTCKRQCISNPSSPMLEPPTSASRDSSDPSSGNSLPESSSLQQNISRELLSSINDHTTIDENTTN
ncbi:uncharacterized protein BYT42DRAFT_525032 [Radiomyces spectabilis]|uniref:uncharacterized protein n=1 Tax=Radiomyces spectabilis TaxID=64574 RepID=UPI00222120C4|nr:uncharacterized protein BYT42DRAFT_525032 [Radiomyces spectabilis]KAI8393777.1 hypothetical protein BYT42DRAFT_525032 [Radiomyces spectabilis]